MSLKENKKIVKMLGVFWIQNWNSQNKIILETLQNSDEPRTFLSYLVSKWNVIRFGLCSDWALHGFGFAWCLENPKPAKDGFLGYILPNWKLPCGSTSIHARLFASWDIFTRSHFRIFIAISSICSTLSLEMVRTSAVATLHTFAKLSQVQKYVNFFKINLFFS